MSNVFAAVGGGYTLIIAGLAGLWRRSARRSRAAEAAELLAWTETLLHSYPARHRAEDTVDDGPVAPAAAADDDDYHGRHRLVDSPVWSVGHLIDHTGEIAVEHLFGGRHRTPVGAR